MRRRKHPFITRNRAPLVLLCTGLLLYLLPGRLAFPVQGRIVSASANVAGLFSSGPEEPENLPAVKRLRRDLTLAQQELAAARNELHLLRGELESVTSVKSAASVELVRVIPARVVMRRDASNFRRTVLVNRGARDGVQPGMPVLWGCRPRVGEGLRACVVGRVGAVGPRAARILLASDPGFRVPARLLESRQRVIVEGCAGRWPMRIKHAGSELDVDVGEMVLTSGSLGAFPAGLLVGTVTTVQGREYAGKMQVCIDSPVDLDELESVLIVELAKLEGPGEGK